MSRYIDADKLYDFMNRANIPYNALVQEAINFQPSIDIVRCDECQYYEDGHCESAEMWQSINGYTTECESMSRNADDFCSYGSRSEKPNNCEHITEDGVTCAKYPACDDCLDNPLKKIKGSERLVKGLEQTDCQTCKWWSSYGYCVHRECKGYEPQTERSSE